MRNARNCGCSFNQDRNTSSYVGERIRVNQGCSRCENENRERDTSSGDCQDSYRPRPCPPKPCPPRPCPPRPCPPKPCPPRPRPPKPCPPRPCPCYEEQNRPQPCQDHRMDEWNDDCDCQGTRPYQRKYYEEDLYEDEDDES